MIDPRTGHGQVEPPGTSVPSPARVPSLARDRCPGQTGGTRPGVRPGGLTLTTFAVGPTETSGEEEKKK